MDMVYIYQHLEYINGALHNYLVAVVVSVNRHRTGHEGIQKGIRIRTVTFTIILN